MYTIIRVILFTSDYAYHLSECKISKEAWNYLERKYDNLFSTVEDRLVGLEIGTFRFYVLMEFHL